jgi:DNA-binding response OmpR family regulator
MRAAIERGAPAAVLLDIGLPGEDGLTLARHLRSRYDCGIIMITGADAVVDRVVEQRSAATPSVPPARAVRAERDRR